MNVPFVDLKAQYQSIREEMDEGIQDVIANAAFVGGPAVKAFEEEFARFCAVKSCVGVGNGTDALYLALRCSGVGAGHEVIVPANTFVATSEAVTMTGAKVVFCDVDPRTYNLDVTRLPVLVNNRTRAILPVHLYGQPADMQPILGLAGAKDLIVIEDAAQAHGAEYRGIRAGTIGHAGCFSFYPGKNLGAYGDAGAVVSNDEAFAAKVRMTANHGRAKKYDHLFEAVNSRLDAVQAAVLKTKLRHLETWTEERRANASLYNELLDGTPVATPHELPNVRAVYHLYVIRVPDGKRDALRSHLADNGIATGVHYPIALPNLQAYSYLGHREEDFPVATRLSKEILSLPMFPELTRSQVEYVAENIRRFLA